MREQAYGSVQKEVGHRWFRAKLGKEEGASSRGKKNVARASEGPYRQGKQPFPTWIRAAGADLGIPSGAFRSTCVFRSPDRRAKGPKGPGVCAGTLKPQAQM